jgi:hypothetical protein
VIWALCRTQLVCAFRRAADAFATSPLIVGGLALAAAVVPALALWGGARLAAPVQYALESDAAATHASAVSLCIAAALVGGVVTALAPGRDALGAQLAAAPLSRRTSFAGSTLLPSTFALTAFAVPPLLFLAPVARGAAPSAAAAMAAAAALGGALVEGCLALARRALHGCAVIAAAALLVAFDPSAALAAALVRDARASSLALAAGSMTLWICAAATRPEPVQGGARVRVVARGPFGCALARYFRARELRIQAWLAIVAAGGGAALLRAVAVPPGGAAVLGACTGILGASSLTLAALGVDRRAEWLWRSAPYRRSALGAIFAVGAVAASSAVALLACAAAVMAAPAAVHRLLPLVAFAALSFAAALIAGAAVPWRAGRAAEQLATYAAFAAVAAALAAALAKLAPLVHAEAGTAAGVLAGFVLVAGVITSVTAAAR